MIIEAFGSPEVFKPAEIPTPKLKPGHVLIRVEATSVNPMDTLIRGMGPPFVAPQLPAILHADVAGTIVEVAPDVKEFKPGDQVYACAGGVTGMGGALAEFMLADAALVAPKPKTLSMRAAAALPLVTITAWEALYGRMQLKPGQRILIHGAAGGVGHIAIQLAKLAGAAVYATASSDKKLAIGLDLGADAGINYRETSVQDYVAEYTGGQGFDVVFDTVGHDNLARSLGAAKLNGDVATTVSIGPHDLTMAHLRGLSLHVVFMLIPMLYNRRRAEHGRILRAAAALVDEGKLRPLTDPQMFTISQVADAHRLMESGEHLGKIVLTQG